MVAIKKPVVGPKGKKKAQVFVIDCAKPVEDKIMEIGSFEKFLLDKIKVDGKIGVQDTFHTLSTGLLYQFNGVFVLYPILIFWKRGEARDRKTAIVVEWSTGQVAKVVSFI